MDSWKNFLARSLAKGIEGGWWGMVTLNIIRRVMHYRETGREENRKKRREDYNGITVQQQQLKTQGTHTHTHTHTPRGRTSRLKPA